MRFGTIFIVTLSFMLAGCGSSSGKLSKFRTQNRTNLMRLTLGISKDSTLSIMGVGSIEVSNKWEVGILSPSREDKDL